MGIFSLRFNIATKMNLSNFVSGEPVFRKQKNKYELSIVAVYLEKNRLIKKKKFKCFLFKKSWFK